MPSSSKQPMPMPMLDIRVNPVRRASRQAFLTARAEDACFSAFVIFRGFSDTAVGKQTRALKSVIKWNKNFDRYVHGDNQCMKKGYGEETGM